MLRNTIKMNLITVFSAIILIPFLALSVYLITQESRKINSRTFAALNQNCVSVADAAQREIVTFKPAANAVIGSVLLTPGSTRHALPAGTVALIDVPRNLGAAGTTPGRAISAPT